MKAIILARSAGGRAGPVPRRSSHQPTERPHVGSSHVKASERTPSERMLPSVIGEPGGGHDGSYLRRYPRKILGAFKDAKSLIYWRAREDETGNSYVIVIPIE